MLTTAHVFECVFGVQIRLRVTPGMIGTAWMIFLWQHGLEVGRKVFRRVRDLIAICKDNKYQARTNGKRGAEEGGRRTEDFEAADGGWRS